MTVFIIVTVFTICWIPTGIYMTIHLTGRPKWFTEGMFILSPIGLVVNSIANPIVYMLRSRTYAQTLVWIFTCGMYKGSSIRSQDETVRRLTDNLTCHQSTHHNTADFITTTTVRQKKLEQNNGGASSDTLADRRSSSLTTTL